jgi:hypothetical protein
MDENEDLCQECMETLTECGCDRCGTCGLTMDGECECDLAQWRAAELEFERRDLDREEI